MDKIKAIIDDLRHERYRWNPARRVYIPKKNGTTRPLGVQSWSDKLVQGVIRLLLDAYLSQAQNAGIMRTLPPGCDLWKTDETKPYVRLT